MNTKITKKQFKKLKAILRRARKYRAKVGRKQNRLECELMLITGPMGVDTANDAVVNDCYKAAGLLKRLGLTVAGR